MSLPCTKSGAGVLTVLTALVVGSCGGASSGVNESQTDRNPHVASAVDVNRPTTPLSEHVQGLAALILEEDDETIVVNPRTRVTADGDLVIADRAEHQVRSYAPDGRLHWRFGHKGRGPTDLLEPMRAVQLADSSVFVISYMSHDALWLPGYDRVRYTLPRKSIRLPVDAVALGDTLVARGTRSRFRPDTTLPDPLVEVFHATDGQLRSSFFVPEIDGLTAQAVGADGFANLAARGDTLAVAFSLGTAIHLFTSDGRGVDTISIPFARYVRPDFTPEEFIEKAFDLTIDYTAIESLFWLADGSFVLEIRDRRNGPRDVSWHVLRVSRDGRFLFESPVARLRTVDPQQLRIYVQDPDHLEPNRWLVGELSPADG